MKQSTLFSVLGLGMLLTSANVEARGGAHFHGGWHGGGHHWNGGGHHWGGGRVYHGNYGRHGYYANNYYGVGYGGWGYGGGWGYRWPGYYTGGPVGYYNIAPAGCVKRLVCNKYHRCHYQRFCGRY